MQVTLDIKVESHWNDLLQIIEKHNISFQIDNENDISEEEQIEKDWEFIRKGIEVDDPKQFMKDFGESRQDRKLISLEEEREKNWEILMKGVKFDNFDKFMEDFEEYRKDPPRPYRN